jgi:ATP-dependent Clp protease ATP-binding subunit ClpB
VPEIGREEVAAAVSAMSGIELGSLSSDRTTRLLNLDTTLATHVIGQDDAITLVAAAARRAGAGLYDPDKPLASFLFCGPSGVGKTMTAKLLAEAFFGDGDAVTQFDMSEYPEAHDVSRLLGAAPGYVGYREGGQLIDAVRRKRAQVLLFDEVEKADPKIFDVLLALLDEGRVRGGDGRIGDARGCVVVLTSNLGSHSTSRSIAGFSTEEQRAEAYRLDVARALAEFFRPEFLNRIDTTVVFNALSDADLVTIAHLELAAVVSRVAERGIRVLIGEGVAAAVVRDAREGGGARAVRRSAERVIEDRLADAILSGAVRPGDTVQLGYDGGEMLTLTLVESGVVVAPA